MQTQIQAQGILIHTERSEDCKAKVDQCQQGRGATSRNYEQSEAISVTSRSRTGRERPQGLTREVRGAGLPSQHRGSDTWPDYAQGSRAKCGASVQEGHSGCPSLLGAPVCHPYPRIRVSTVYAEAGREAISSGFEPAKWPPPVHGGARRDP